MLRNSALAVTFTTVVLLTSVHGQSPNSGNDLITACETFSDIFGEAEFVFTARAESPVTLRISYEAEIEEARQNLIRTEAEVARLKASLDLKTRLERETEFAIRIIEAHKRLDLTRAFYPPPEELTLIPVHVEQVFRGVIPPTLMLFAPPDVFTIEPGVLYLLAGRRVREEIPGLSIMGVRSVTDAQSATHELRFLGSFTSGATILGWVHMHSYTDSGPAPLGDVRIRASTGTQVVETMIREDGSFTFSGIQPGRVEIKPLLHEDLIVVNRSALTIEIREGGCKAVHLMAAPNGRVRGRIFSATGTSLDGVELFLDGGISSDGGLEIHRSFHAPRSSARPNEDGTFEFSGVFPGSYILGAGLQRIVDGNKRYLVTYFPGTPDLAAARRIDVGRATLHDGVDFLVRTE